MCTWHWNFIRWFCCVQVFTGSVINISRSITFINDEYTIINVFVNVHLFGGDFVFQMEQPASAKFLIAEYEFVAVQRSRHICINMNLKWRKRKIIKRLADNYYLTQVSHSEYFHLIRIQPISLNIPIFSGIHRYWKDISFHQCCLWTWINNAFQNI